MVLKLFGDVGLSAREGMHGPGREEEDEEDEAQGVVADEAVIQAPLKSKTPQPRRRFVVPP